MKFVSNITQASYVCIMHNNFYTGYIHTLFFILLKYICNIHVKRKHCFYFETQKRGIGLWCLAPFSTIIQLYQADHRIVIEFIEIVVLQQLLSYWKWVGINSHEKVKNVHVRSFKDLYSIQIIGSFHWNLKKNN